MSHPWSHFLRLVSAPGGLIAAISFSSSFCSFSVWFMIWLVAFMAPLCMPACVLNCFRRVQLFATPWTKAHQAPLSMKFPRQEYWRGLPFPSPGDLLTQGSNLCLLHCKWIPYHWPTSEAHENPWNSPIANCVAEPALRHRFSNSKSSSQAAFMWGIITLGK